MRWLLGFAMCLKFSMACTIDAQCSNALCWGGQCMDPFVPVARTVDATFLRECSDEVQIYYNVFYERTCMVTEYIPTVYGLACRYTCEPIFQGPSMLLENYKYGPHHIRLEINQTAICVE